MLLRELNDAGILPQEHRVDQSVNPARGQDRAKIVHPPGRLALDMDQQQVDVDAALLSFGAAQTKADDVCEQHRVLLNSRELDRIGEPFERVANGHRQAELLVEEVTDAGHQARTAGQQY